MKIIPLVSCFLSAAILSACGGGGGGTTSAPSPAAPFATLSGLAASGSALANSTVTARCASGTSVSGVTASDGTFTLTLDGQQVTPCMVQVTGGSPTVSLYGYAANAGRVDVTPFSHLLISRSLGADPAVSFGTFGAAAAANIQANLSSSASYLNAQLALLGIQVPTVNVLTGVFVVGDANDLLFDKFNAQVKAAGRSILDMSAAAAQGTNLIALIVPGVSTADPSAPSAPTLLKIQSTSSNSVALNWSASTGGSGGVYAYSLYRDGQQILGTGAGVTNAVDINLLPGESHSYAVTATSVAGTVSQPSAVVTGSTLSAAMLLAKLSPYILFETATGKVWAQFLASPAIIAAATKNPGFDVIEHARIDVAHYGIRSVGTDQYSIYPYSTGISIEPNVSGVTIGTIVGNVSVIRIDPVSCAPIGTFSGPTEDLLLNVQDGTAAYLSGEIL